MRCVAAAIVFVLICGTPVPAQKAAQGYQVGGRVVMADGSPPPDGTTVELTCSGRMQKRVKPYTNGDYMIQFEDDGQETADIAMPRDLSGGQAEAFSGFAKSMLRAGDDAGRFDFSGCELRAVLPGFRSNVVGMGPRRRLDRPTVGQLVLHRLPNPDNVVYTANTLAAPKPARAALETAWNHLQRDQPDHARALAETERAVKLYPEFAAAWHLMGTTRLALKDEAGAREALNRAIAADATYVEPYIELASLEAQHERWAETAKLIDQVQDINPYIPYVNYLSACAYFHLGQLDIAEESAMEVLGTPELQHYPLIYYILGAIQAKRGDFATAAARFQQFLYAKPDPGVAQSVEELLADWEREGRIKR